MVRGLVEQEARKTGLPADIAEAVVHVESNYDPTVIGRVGEIGLMQVRPETAAMLGFRGTNEELAKPEVNVHYGVIYLSKAWRLANGDLCRALMKYRAGHGEEIMTQRSVEYCRRARNHLAALGSPFAAQGTTWPAVIPRFDLRDGKQSCAEAVAEFLQGAGFTKSRLCAVQARHGRRRAAPSGPPMRRACAPSPRGSMRNGGAWRRADARVGDQPGQPLIPRILGAFGGGFDGGVALAPLRLEISTALRPEISWPASSGICQKK